MSGTLFFVPVSDAVHNRAGAWASLRVGVAAALQPVAGVATPLLLGGVKESGYLLLRFAIVGISQSHNWISVEQEYNGKKGNR